MRNLVRAIYLWFRRIIMVRSGFDPARPYWYSAEGHDYAALSKSTSKSPLYPPNLAGHYHVALQTFWESRGLGAKCFLISESKGVAAYLSKRYPETHFCSLDLYTELQVEKFGGTAEQPDFLWDVNAPPFRTLASATR
ncbi:hypothetical protein [Methylococcus capsulatus]|uniref:hypothetical protein n=1 Tax=Methylococcus capsulatus TaxID=414 RepID=UPI002FD913BB